MKNILRVEIIVPRSELEPVLDLFHEHQVEGYTLVEKVKGMGHRGIQDGLGLTDAFTNSMLIWYCMPDKFDGLKEDIRKLLLNSGGVCAISEGSWIVH